MAQQEEIVLWLDRRWKKAIERHLKDETLQEHLENVLDELCNRLPAHEYERVSAVLFRQKLPHSVQRKKLPVLMPPTMW